MYIWRDPMFESSTIKGKIGKRIAGILESCGLRCSNCGRWLQGSRSTSRSIEWGNDVCDLWLMDPIFFKKKVRTCACGHLMYSRTVVSESA